VNGLGTIGTGGHTDWLAMALQTAHVAVGVSHFRSGVFVEANESFCRLFHCARDELLGQTSAALGLWPDPQQRQRLVEVVQRQGSVTRFEARYRNRLGELGELEISARLVWQQGEPYLIGFLTEVTGQREFVDGLRVAQARLDLVLRSSRRLVFRQDRDLRYTWVANPALGASEADLIGRSDEEIMGAVAAAPLLAIKRRVLATGCAERRDVWVANQGQLGCFDLVVEPERDATGRLCGIVCAAQDITERMLAVPHTRRAPAQAIRGMASLIGREPLTLQQAQRLQRIDQVAADWQADDAGAPAGQQLAERHAGALVVVAEHNPVLRQLIQALLEQVGLRVAIATTGVEAFSLSLQLRPDLLLLDMALPQAGGVAAARALRSMLPQGAPIILATLSADAPVDVARALDADLDEVLADPLSAAQLYGTLLAWLDAR